MKILIYKPKLIEARKSLIPHASTCYYNLSESVDRSCSLPHPACRTKICPAYDFRSHRGFTLVELLIVMVIVAVLALIGVVGTGKMISRANRVGSMSSLKQLATVSQTFSMDNNGAILHESKTLFNGTRRVWPEVLLEISAPETASLDEAGRRNFALGQGLFADKQALKKAQGKLPKVGNGSWRTFAYNNRIGVYQPDSPGGMGWGRGARYTHQIERPEKLILFSHRKLGPNGYVYVLQPGDAKNKAVEYDIYGGSGMVGFYDGHVEMFSEKNFPGFDGKNPMTNSPYTEKEINEFYFGMATGLSPL